MRFDLGVDEENARFSVNPLSVPGLGGICGRTPPMLSQVREIDAVEWGFLVAVERRFRNQKHFCGNNDHTILLRTIICKKNGDNQRIL